MTKFYIQRHGAWLLKDNSIIVDEINKSVNGEGIFLEDEKNETGYREKISWNPGGMLLNQLTGLIPGFARFQKRRTRKHSCADARRSKHVESAVLSCCIQHLLVRCRDFNSKRLDYVSKISQLF